MTRSGEWTLEDEIYLVRNYNKVRTLDSMVEHLGKTENAIRLKASRLGIKRNIPNEEYATLLSDYHYAMEAIDGWLSKDGTLDAILSIVEELLEIRQLRETE